MKTDVLYIKYGNIEVNKNGGEINLLFNNEINTILIYKSLNIYVICCILYNKI